MSKGFVPSMLPIPNTAAKKTASRINESLR